VRVMCRRVLMAQHVSIFRWFFEVLGAVMYDFSEVPIQGEGHIGKAWCFVLLALTHADDEALVV
jgi:hypothetical protein